MENIPDLKQTVTKNKLSGLWRLMDGYHLIYFVAIISMGLSAIAGSGLYILLGRFVDDVLPAENMRQILPWVSLGLVLLALTQGAFTFLGGRLAAQTAEGIARTLRNYLYDHIQKLTFTYHDQSQTGELLQRTTSDVDTVRRMFAEQAIGIGRITLLFAVNFTALLFLNVQLALVSVIVIPIVLIISMFFFVKVGKAYEAFQEQEATLSNRLQENLTGVRVVKAFARQAYEIEAFDVENREKWRRGRRLTTMHATYWPMTDILCGLQMITGFFIAGMMAIDGEITVGMYVAYVGLVAQIIWPIRNLGRLVADISTGFVSFGRVQTVIKEVKEPLVKGDGVTITNGRLQGAVTFEDVHFAYENEEEHALHGVTFTAKPGQKIALMGSTGSGKTSLVNLLPRFYEYESGHITLDGVDLKNYARAFLREQIGIVMQEPFLFSTTIRNNITYGVNREVTDKELFAAAEAAAVHKVIMEFPEGYNTMVGERGVTLSGGQKQRITLARTILRNPGLLILDDATSAVDTETDEAIRFALEKLMQNRTTFIIAHRIQTVMDADLILMLENGRIIQHGTHAELLEEDGQYRQIYDLQSRIEDELEADLAGVTS
jgi:ATP-binding cassette subfamily B protein